MTAHQLLSVLREVDRQVQEAQDPGPSPLTPMFPFCLDSSYCSFPTLVPQAHMREQRQDSRRCWHLWQGLCGEALLSPTTTTTAGDVCCTRAWLPLPSSGTETQACSTLTQKLESRCCPAGLGRAHRWQSPGGCGRHGHGHRISTALRKPQEDSFRPCPLP